MMHLKKLIAGTLLLGTLVTGSIADSSQESPAPLIEWYMIDLPPIQNATGKWRGQGYTDLIRWRLIAKLDQFRHVLRNSNVHRMLSDIRSKPNICNTAFLKTPEREEYMIYANPLHAQFPNGAAILKADRSPEFDTYIDQELLDIDALVEDGGRLVVQSGRSYGTSLDQAIDKARQADQLMVITSNRPVESKLDLLAIGRADVALIYPYEFEQYMLQERELPSKYEFLRAQGVTGYTLNHLACSQSKLGEQVIAASNPLVEQNRDGYFAAAYRAWLPASLLSAHAAHHRHAFDNAEIIDVPATIAPHEQKIADCMLDGGIWHGDQCMPQ